MMCAAQSFDRSLGDAEYEMMDRFVISMGQAALLTDLVDAETVGLENALRVMKDSSRQRPRRHPRRFRRHRRAVRPLFRADESGGHHAADDRLRERGDAGVDPRSLRPFPGGDRREPTMLFPGAGGYWWRLVHRDTVAAAFKRSATGEHPNVKFSNSPGKESLGGYLRVYGDGDTLIVADADEPPPGEPLFVKLVERGRIVYRETFQEQAARADRTWGRLPTLGIVAARGGDDGAFPAHAGAGSGRGAGPVVGTIGE